MTEISSASSHNNFIGVYRSSHNRFSSKITVNKLNVHLGTFADEYYAAKSYDCYCMKNNLDRRLNFPDPEPYNPILNTRLIRLTQGQFAIVDEDDYERVNQFKWSVKTSGNLKYAIRSIIVNGEKKIQKMNSFILNTSQLIDHVNGNGLHNYKTNLRFATKHQNSFNRISKNNNTSKYKGVCKCDGNNKFRAQIKINGKRIHLGYFTNEIEAAKAYDSAAVKYFGEFANTNFKN